jgi:hypothetical protein
MEVRKAAEAKARAEEEKRKEEERLAAERKEMEVRKAAEVEAKAEEEKRREEERLAAERKEIEMRKVAPPASPNLAPHPPPYPPPPPPPPNQPPTHAQLLKAKAQGLRLIDKVALAVARYTDRGVELVRCTSTIARDAYAWCCVAPSPGRLCEEGTGAPRTRGSFQPFQPLTRAIGTRPIHDPSSPSVSLSNHFAPHLSLLLRIPRSCPAPVRARTKGRPD